MASSAIQWKAVTGPATKMHDLPPKNSTPPIILFPPPPPPRNHWAASTTPSFSPTWPPSCRSWCRGPGKELVLGGQRCGHSLTDPPGDGGCWWRGNKVSKIYSTTEPEQENRGKGAEGKGGGGGGQRQRQWQRQRQRQQGRGVSQISFLWQRERAARSPSSLHVLSRASERASRQQGLW
jgi:hypothetical protein